MEIVKGWTTFLPKICLPRRQHRLSDPRAGLINICIYIDCIILLQAMFHLNSLSILVVLLIINAAYSELTDCKGIRETYKAGEKAHSWFKAKLFCDLIQGRPDPGQEKKGPICLNICIQKCTPWEFAEDKPTCPRTVKQFLKTVKDSEEDVRSVSTTTADIYIR